MGTFFNNRVPWGIYTTFSSYSLETMVLFMEGKIGLGLISITLNNVLCLAFVLLGIFIGRSAFQINKI